MGVAVTVGVGGASELPATCHVGALVLVEQSLLGWKDFEVEVLHRLDIYLYIIIYYIYTI